MKFLRQSTAATIVVGPFLSATDGKAPVTTLTIASTLNGRAISNGTAAAYAPTSFVHDANGYYLVSLAAGDVPGVNRFVVNFSDPTTYCAIWQDFTVYAPAVFDVQFGTVAPQTVGVPVTLPATFPANSITTATFAAGTILPRVTVVDTVSVLTAGTVSLAAGAITTATFATGTILPRVTVVDTVTALANNAIASATFTAAAVIPRVTLVDSVVALGAGAITANTLAANTISSTTFASNTILPRVTTVDTLQNVAIGAIPGLVTLPYGLVQAGSTVSSLLVAGGLGLVTDSGQYSTRKLLVGAVPIICATHSYAAGVHTFTLGNGVGELGPLMTAPTPGAMVTVCG